uniref:NTR domain-containing protein n=1 Tax=Parascaris univalens TaxID=6257 RepID=A0A915CD88_PARUN
MKLILTAALVSTILEVSTACSCLSTTPIESYNLADWRKFSQLV